MERMFPLPGRVAPLSSLDTSLGATAEAQNQFLEKGGNVLNVLPSTPQEHMEKTIKDIHTDNMVRVSHSY